MKNIFYDALFWILHYIMRFVHWLLPVSSIRTNIFIKIMRMQKKLYPELPDVEEIL